MLRIRSMSRRGWHGEPLAELCPEDVDDARYVVAADGALGHALPTLRAGDHVTALEQDAVDDGVHADLAEFAVVNALQNVA